MFAIKWKTPKGALVLTNMGDQRSNDSHWHVEGVPDVYPHLYPNRKWAERVAQKLVEKRAKRVIIWDGTRYHIADKGNANISQLGNVWEVVEIAHMSNTDQP